MGQDVFISYARQTSSADAIALHAEFEQGTAYLDTAKLAHGNQIGAEILDAILSARVFVAFVDPAYLRSWYCLRELHVALAAHSAIVARDGSEDERLEALEPIIIGLPNRSETGATLEHLPPLLAGANWPIRTDTQRLSELVRQRCATSMMTIGDRLKTLNIFDSVRMTLAEEFRLPRTAPSPEVRRWALPGELRASIGQAFVGRADEVWQIHYQLATLRGGVRSSAAILALDGSAGSGKTRLATEYVHRLAARTFLGGIFWVNAALENRLEEQLYGVLKSLVPGVPSLVALRESKRDVGDELRAAVSATPADQPILYVIDNLPEPEVGEAPPSLATFCPMLGDVTVLVTSRVRQLGPEVMALTVSVLQPDAARILLTRDVTDRTSLLDAEWDALTAWVGQLPLALEILNSALRGGVFLPRELYELLDTSNPVPTLDSSADALRHSLPSGDIRGVTAAFSVSYSRLPAAAQRAARIVAHLAAAPIPLAIVTALGAELMPPGARALLSSRSFVATVPSTRDVPFFGQMHRLLAAFLRDKSTGDPEILHQLYIAITSLIRVADGASVRELAVGAACVPHASELYAQLASGSLADREAAIDLGIQMANILGRQGWIMSARDVAGHNTALACQTLGDTHPLALRAMAGVAVYAHLAGDLTGARAIEERLVRERRRSLGEEHPDTLASMSRLAVMLGTDGELSAAATLTQQLIAVRQRVQGDHHPDTLALWSNLGELHRRQGDVTRARAIGEWVLEVQRRTLGNDHAATIRSMHNLAAALRETGDLINAESLARHVVDRRRHVHGPAHLNTLRSMRVLAETLQTANKLDEAIQLHRTVLDAVRHALGESHPETIRTSQLLASALRARGDVSEAAAIEASLGGNQQPVVRFGTELR